MPDEKHAEILNKLIAFKYHITHLTELADDINKILGNQEDKSRQAILMAVDQLKQDEGFSAKPYKCPAGKLTIGYGFNLDDNSMTRKQALFLLEDAATSLHEDLMNHYSFYANLNNKRKAVIINMAYNLGVAGLVKFTWMIKAILDGDFKLAAHEMVKSKWAEQVPLRAERLSKLMEFGKGE
jgi:lysozyme